MTGPGGSGITSGEDYVAARLSVDIPEGSSQGIREIREEVEKFRIAMEATTRAEADMTRYLEQMNDASKKAVEMQKNLTQSLQTYLSLQGRVTGQNYGGGPSGVAGGATLTPFAEGAPGMGMSSSGYRPPNPSDVAYQVGQYPQRSPGSHVNMQQVRGNVADADLVALTPQTVADLSNKLASRENALKTQHEQTDGNRPHPPAPRPHEEGSPIEDAASKIRGGAGLAGQVLHEMGPAGENMAMGEMMVQGLQWARKRFSPQAPGRGSEPVTTGTRPDGMPPPGAPGMGSSPSAAGPEGEAAESGAEDLTKGAMGLSGVAKMLGPIAGAATAALSIFGLIQKGGEEIQGMRNVASLRGGAAGEGFQAEGRERMMAAMNPFISRDQARSIFQAAMSEGYADASGGGADNVIEFMKQNLTTMNISVADSMKMLRSTIVGNQKGDPDSVNGAVSMLREELDSIRTMSRGSAMSTPDMTRNVMDLQNKLIAQGASPDQARNAAMMAEGVGANDHVLANQFASGMGDMSSDVQGEAWLRMYGGYQLPADLDPENISGYLADKGELPQASWNAMRRMAQMAQQQRGRGPNGERNAVRMFMRMLRNTPMAHEAFATNYGEAASMYKKLLGSSTLPQDVAVPTMSADSGSEGERPDSGASSQSLPTPQPDPSSATAPSGGGAPIFSYAGGGGGGGGGGGTGAVTLDLTPAASKLLQVVGPNPTPLTPTQRGANAGRGGYQLNDPSA